MHAVAARPPGHTRPGRRAPRGRRRDPRQCRPGAQRGPGDGARCGASATALGSVNAKRQAPVRSHPALAAAAPGNLHGALSHARTAAALSNLASGWGWARAGLRHMKHQKTHQQADRLLQRLGSPPKGFCFVTRAAASGPASYEAQHGSNAIRVTMAVLGCIRHTPRLQVRGRYVQ